MDAELLEIARWVNDKGDELVFYRGGDLWVRSHLKQRFRRMIKRRGRKFEFDEVLMIARQCNFQRVVKMECEP